MQFLGPAINVPSPGWRHANARLRNPGRTPARRLTSRHSQQALQQRQRQRTYLQHIAASETARTALACTHTHTRTGKAAQPSSRASTVKGDPSSSPSLVDQTFSLFCLSRTEQRDKNQTDFFLGVSTQPSSALRAYLRLHHACPGAPILLTPFQSSTGRAFYLRTPTEPLRLFPVPRYPRPRQASPIPTSRPCRFLP